MLDHQRICSPKLAPTQSWSSGSLKNEPQKVIRKFINAAVYVEKQIMPPLRKKSPLYLDTASDGGNTSRTISTDRSVKRCTCITSPKTCPCHPMEDKPEKKLDNCDSSSSSSDVGSQITVKSKKITSFAKQDSEMNLSLTSLYTDRTERLDPKEKETIIKSWLNKKDMEKKKQELKEEKSREAKQRERELIREKEKENFQKWLARKKDKEAAKKKEEERKKEEEKLKEAEKERKQKLNETSYQSWLRRNKRVELERKIKEKLALIQLYEEKQKRLEENEKAFMDWFENSKRKPKPVALNQGLKSLCSSTSITYINPVPWIPNVELAQKPASQ
ncbi:unnamed protein product [Phaedon cochleariae]|uniref:Coiled-coil domain-containing protein n=1 Tax=Phaedon cochleariae TaxID=80249 RepID=A0A9N9SAG5_PHACE|nr:unnamed protein product [Phaedon cochleariae]